MSEYRDVRSRIDLEYHLASLNGLALRKVDALQNPVDLRLHGDSLHWLSDAVGGDDVRHRRTAHGRDAHRDLWLPGGIILRASRDRCHRDRGNARVNSARAHSVAWIWKLTGHRRICGKGEWRVAAYT